MEKICTLCTDVNSCQYMGKNMECTAPHDNCGMLQRVEPIKKQMGYVRQERWFEKYYKQ